MYKKQFGGKITEADEKKYAKSVQWKSGKFENLEETTMSLSFSTLPKLLYKQFCEKEGREPEKPLPIAMFDKKAFLEPSDNMKFVWYGHSVVLMRLNGQTLLIDPMFGGNAAPIAPFAVKRFSANTLELIEKLPEIDLLLLTHDHYDHLDLESILRLKNKVKKFYVALGVKRHLIKWGIDADIIQEFDWWDHASFNGINITFTPTRHFSGRGLRDRAKSLWGGWVFKTVHENIWFSGDGGYGKHFKDIGEKLGPFDFAFMECGQYNENWHQIHMCPEEAVQAAIDAHSRMIMAVHWAGFSLAQHSWTDPIERFVKEAIAKQIPLLHPTLGEVVDYSTHQNTTWWKQ